MSDLIRSYGLHWSDEHVTWGGRGVEGHLYGIKTRSSLAREVDFREQRGLYALYAEYELVYIGQTGSGDNRLLKRLRSHRIDHLADRWNRFSWFGLNGVTNSNVLHFDRRGVHITVKDALNVLEAVSTAISEPRLNLQRGRWSDTSQYFQYRPGAQDEDDGEA
ncbi:hypothetical protein FHR90_003272 [Endobacter medicaginis]|uniref:GIY-YIG nuclease family protein n=1 Tax=Endobacter medicaginis TaxID=1181271 RepID=A0A839UZU0_9PROT|nr:GIY-YIG nuclease family protein [Endobacter medicaginis]MBB3175417.1 hypothetical protein [Endobacter medicaginis]MCX5476878.1 GIY-YIG nuclease family protein [Endobacter medicaginis]NVN29581.1 GIY-YIG nuclease family protein [Endobacter medicaginis]